ncbi:CDP-alcohol phosphatidyltransferase family protein [bacterium]|nr:MAG: CDP-alcohol phosphatidyltransferase family protein [bacterium]
MSVHSVWKFLVDRFTGRNAKNFVVREKIFTVPNMITMSGVVSTTFYVFQIVMGTYLFLVPVVVAYNYLTDALDGLFADLLDQHSALGKMMDRFRDRYMIMALLLNAWLVGGNDVLTPIFVILAVEIPWLIEVVWYQNHYGKAPETHCLGKMRTFLQGVVLWIMVVEMYWLGTFYISISFLLWSATFMSVVAVAYNNWKMVRKLS